MKHSAKVALGVTAAVATVGAIGYGAAHDEPEQEPTHAAVCVDEATQTRIDESQCDDDPTRHVGGHGWYFIPFGMVFPRVGGRVSGGSFSAPAGSAYVTGGVPAGGGKVSSGGLNSGTIRGGFGGAYGGSGG